MNDKQNFEIKPMGECAIHIIFGTAINPTIHKLVKGMSDYLETHTFKGFVEYIASYTAVTVMYNPYVVTKAYSLDNSHRVYEYLSGLLSEYATKAGQMPATKPDIVEIPVCYGGEYGPDLEQVAEYHHLTTEEVIKIHSSGEYLVYMIGFCPGFPYLGGLDKRIATPRRESPRLAIPARSIGIAGEQTGGYPISTPGGWNLIGRSAVEMFDVKNTKHPSLLKAGDIVHFKAISCEEYKVIRGNAK